MQCSKVQDRNPTIQNTQRRIQCIRCPLLSHSKNHTTRRPTHEFPFLDQIILEICKAPIPIPFPFVPRSKSSVCVVDNNDSWLMSPYPAMEIMKEWYIDFFHKITPVTMLSPKISTCDAHSMHRQMRCRTIGLRYIWHGRHGHADVLGSLLSRDVKDAV
jgi:hypothetical protein